MTATGAVLLTAVLVVGILLAVVIIASAVLANNQRDREAAITKERIRADRDIAVHEATWGKGWAPRPTRELPHI